MLTWNWLPKQVAVQCLNWNWLPQQVVVVLVRRRLRAVGSQERRVVVVALVVVLVARAVPRQPWERLGGPEGILKKTNGSNKVSRMSQMSPEHLKLLQAKVQCAVETIFAMC